MIEELEKQLADCEKSGVHIPFRKANLEARIDFERKKRGRPAKKESCAYCDKEAKWICGAPERPYHACDEHKDVHQRTLF